MDKIKKIVSTTLIIGAVSVAPLVPREMPAHYFQDVASNFTENIEIVTEASTSTPAKTEWKYNYHPPTFKDEDGNGLISASIFLKDDGTTEVVQISDEIYAKMGETGGIAFNPKKIEFLTPIEAITAKAEAAIARDATSTSGVLTATSQTWAHTVTGSNPVLLLYGFVRNTNATNLQLATYNGVQMSTTTPAWTDYLEGRYGWMMHLANPATGANNIVTLHDSSVSTIWAAVSFSGAAQTGIPDSVLTDPGDGASATYSLSTTVVAANSWVVLMHLGVDGVCSAATSPDVLINTDNPVMADSNATVAAGAYDIQVSGCGNRVQVKGIVSLAPFVAAVGGGSPQDLILIQDD